MTHRVVAVLARSNPALPDALTDAMLDDVMDVATDTELVDVALAVAGGSTPRDPASRWPGIDIVHVEAQASVSDVLRAVETTDATEVAAVVSDVPDLPPLLLGKLFSALAGPRGAAVAACPAEDGGLVAVAAMVPLSGWLRAAPLRFDDPRALDVLRAAAPLIELSVGPGWHRVRQPADVERLDPGLEGWAATRAYLGR